MSRVHVYVRARANSNNVGGPRLVLGEGEAAVKEERSANSGSLPTIRFTPVKRKRKDRRVFSDSSRRRGEHEEQQGSPCSGNGRLIGFFFFFLDRKLNPPPTRAPFCLPVESSSPPSLFLSIYLSSPLLALLSLFLIRPINPATRPNESSN